MFEISRQATKLLPGPFISLTLVLALGFPNCALSQDGQLLPTVQDHDIEIVESPLSQPQAFSPFSQSSPTSLAWPSLGQSSLGSYPGLGTMRRSSIPFMGSIPYVGVPYVGVPYVGVPYLGAHVPSLSIPYVGGFGGLGTLSSIGSIGGLVGHSGWGRGSWSDPYRFYRSAGSFGAYPSYGSGLGSGLGYGLGSSFGSSYSSAYSWARPFGRLSNQSFIQTAPSKAAGNYYAPATVDPSAAGSYYADSQPAQKPRNQVFGKDYSDYGNYNRSKASSYGNSDHTKPQKDYWGGSGSPFPKDLNSTPWSK